MTKMKFKEFDVEEIASNMYTKGIVPESFLPTLKPDLVSKCVSIDVVTDYDEVEDENGELQEIETVETFVIVILKYIAYPPFVPKRKRATYITIKMTHSPVSGTVSIKLWKLILLLVTTLLGMTLLSFGSLATAFILTLQLLILLCYLAYITQT